MSSKDNVVNPERRSFLGTVTTVAGVGGAAAACWPLVNSMNPSGDVLSNATTEVDLTQIAVGAMHTVAWQGKPVFILHRTPEEIEKMKALSSIEPVADDKRVQNPQWLVVVGICTHLGCVPNRREGGWLCACHGSQYDDSGRVIHGPAPHNLEVPPYKFVSADKIVIG
jgi:ubiquinol-cytochrome c reductase iron-sulfur subunit